MGATPEPPPLDPDTVFDELLSRPNRAVPEEGT